MRISLCNTRKKLARKLDNPRLDQIHFHTLRHWKATTLYHQTKDILYVKQFMGHRRIESTLVYVQIENALFQNMSEAFTCKVAETID
jgi:site-specific recombinase XerD